MILNKIKSKKGSALILCLSILMLLTMLASTGHKTSRSEVTISSSVYASGMLFQAAEASLEEALVFMFDTEKGMESLMNMGASDLFYFCKDFNGVKSDKKEDCEKSSFNSNGSIKAYSKVERNSETECLSYGSSEQKAHCYVLKAESGIKTLNDRKEVHVQEVQINTVNISNNGVYEM